MVGVEGMPKKEMILPRCIKCGSKHTQIRLSRSNYTQNWIRCLDCKKVFLLP